MKNFFALFLAMVMALSIVSTAFAAENYDNTATTQVVNGRAFESVRVAVSSDGKLAAVKTLKESYSSLKGYAKEEIKNISSVLKSGGILRAKGLIKGSLDERSMLAEGSTSVLLALEVINLEQLQLALGDGVEINAVAVMDCASIAHDGHIGHRCVDRPTNLVARFRQQDGSVLNVYYDFFDNQRKLVFDAEAISVAPTSKPEQPQPEQPAPEQPQPEQPAPEQPQPEQPAPEQPQQPTTAPQVTPNPENDDVILPWAPQPEQPAPAPQVTPNPENDDVILPWASTESSTQTSQESEPDPENDDVTLPW